MGLKIAFIFNKFASFIEQDIKILTKDFDVYPVQYRNPMDILTIASTVFNSDITFSWFAAGHAAIVVLVSKLFRKKSIVVVGGYEVWGGQSWIRQAITNFVLDYADLLLPVSEYTKLQCGTRENIEMLYNGIDTGRFCPSRPKENLVMTVAHTGKGEDVLERKGINTFIKAARQLSDVKFVVIGLSEEDLQTARAKTLNNLTLLGHITDDELLGFYQRAKVYCQLSQKESFGVAMAEAMSCECVPVYVAGSALDEVADDAGYCVPSNDVYATISFIQIALNSDLGTNARKRIKKIFSANQRGERLRELIISKICYRALCEKCGACR